MTENVKNAQEAEKQNIDTRKDLDQAMSSVSRVEAQAQQAQMEIARKFDLYRTAADELLTALYDFGRHDIYCSMRNTDFCDCGLGDIRRRYRELLHEARRNT